MAPLTTCIIREVFLSHDGKRKQAPFTFAHLLNVNIRFFIIFSREKPPTLHKLTDVDSSYMFIVTWMNDLFSLNLLSSKQAAYLLPVGGKCDFFRLQL